jgi:ubiquinone/menaquinone biosynthesis C-methylase UbiE
MRQVAIALLAAAAMQLGWVSGAGPEEPSTRDHDATVHHAFNDPERWAETFDSPERRAWQLPAIVVRVLGIESGDSVADLGAGTGYFTQVLSRAVGSAGRVWAVDIEPEMLAHIEKRDDLGPGKVIPVLAAPDDPKLPEADVDLVLVVNTWHHIDARLDYLKRLEKTLTERGRVAIIDWHEGELPLGPPPGAKLSREALLAEFEQAGWRLATESVALPYQYLLVFYPPRG